MEKVTKYIVSLLTCVAFFAQVNAQKTDSDIALKICSAMESAKTMACDFTQTKKTKMLKAPMVMKGRLYTRQPNSVRWECEYPNHVTFVTDGKYAKILKDGKLTETDLTGNKIYQRVMRISKGRLSIADLLKSDDFIQTATETTNEWVITLIPQRKELKQVVASITIHADKKDAIAKKIVLTDKNGDTTTIELKNIETNKNIDASLFNIGQ